MRKTIIALILPGLLAACSKNGEKINPADYKTEIYRLSSYQSLTNTCAINTGTAVLETIPVVEDSSILQYNSTDHFYRLSASAANRLRALRVGEPLAITINKVPVFYFLHFPAISSSACDGSITAQVLGNDMYLQMGYVFTAQIPDVRNDARLMAVLKAKGKL